MAVLADWRHAVRVFLRNPGLTTVAVASLALGIGVGTAVFSVADASSLRPLAVSDPGQLVEVFARSDSGHKDTLSYPEALEIAQVPAFGSIAAYDLRGALLQRGDEIEMLALEAVSDDYFSTLGVRAALGRVISAGVDSGLPAPAVVISDRLWRMRFGADASLLGRTIELTSRPYTLVGVLPPGFRGVDRGLVHDVWVSLGTWDRTFGGNRGNLQNRQARNFHVIARLRPGASAQQAASQLEVVNARWAGAWPALYRGRSLHAARSRTIAGEATPVVLMLLAGAGLLVLVGCFNVSTLLLGLADSRRGEIGIRQALGATRADIARQMLAESTLLSLAGLAAGLGLAALLLRAAPALLPPSPLAMDFALQLDRRVLLCAALFGVASALVGGLAPALRAGSMLIGASWHVTENAPGTRRLLSLPTLLVGLQVALAVVAVNGAALLVGSFAAVRGASHGFDTGRSLLVLQIGMGDTNDRTLWTASLDAARQRALALPGVVHASYVRRVPMAGYGAGATLRVGRSGAEARDTRFNQAGPGFAETLGLSLKRGRFFSDQEHSGRLPVAVVSEAGARAWFPEGEAVGRSLIVQGEPHTVVGVVEDTPVSRLHEDPEAFVYVPYSRLPTRDSALLLQTDHDPAAFTAVAKAVVRDTCPGARVVAAETLRSQMQAALHGDWLPAVLGTGLAALGVLLALAGLYATVARLASRRTREIGVRMALGAASGQVLRLVLWQGLALSAIGGVLGLAAAAASAGILRSLLHGIAPLDARALLTSAAVAIAMGLLAAAGPAWRAVKTDPARVLRSE